MKHQMSSNQELAYIAAFIDGEGWIVNHRVNGTGKLQRKIGFTNTNKILFDALVVMLNRAGFEINVCFRPSKNPKHSDRWDGNINGGKESFAKFYEKIPLHHPGKIKRLEEILESYITPKAAHKKRAEARWSKYTIEGRKTHSKKMLDARWGQA